MNYKDNTPTYNVNRKIVNFKDFNPEEEKQELQKIKRSIVPNTPNNQQHIGNTKYKYNKVTHKMDDISIDEINDDLEAIEERYKQDTITMTVPLFIRILEYAHEDAKNDIDLHNATENAIKLSMDRTLNMDDYNEIIK
jgi:hypothetical protein